MNKVTIGSPLDTTFPPLENVIEEQSSNNELSMVQETTNNPLNDPSMTDDKSVKKLPSSTDPADNNFVSFDVDNCINNFRTSEKNKKQKNAKENIVITSEMLTKRLLIVGDSIVGNIDPYKMKKSSKYVTAVKSISGATTEAMIHHVKGCMVDFASDIVLLQMN